MKEIKKLLFYLILLHIFDYEIKPAEYLQESNLFLIIYRFDKIRLDGSNYNGISHRVRMSHVVVDESLKLEIKQQ